MVISLIKEYWHMEGEKAPLKEKSSFCRFYLRGLCVKPPKECPFAHGVWDLRFTPYDGEPVLYDYHKSRDHLQPNTVKGPGIYKVLYDFQDEKIFTLQELNQQKPKRYLIRVQMYQRLYDEFMDLLEATYPGVPFTDEFLRREFNRVGFNKILMAEVKFPQIANYLCDNPPHSKYYRATQGKQTILRRKAPMGEIIEAYRIAVQKMIGEGEEVDEAVLKKKIYTMQMPDGVPAINHILKELKITLKQFVVDRLGIGNGKIAAECSVETVVATATKFIQLQTDKRMVGWNQVFQHVSRTLKNNNGNLINQARPALVLEGYAFLCFPMLQLIFHPQRPPLLEREPCTCPYQKPYPIEELLLPAEGEPLAEGESIDIFNFQTLSRCARAILGSSVVGVDLQGRLRRGGFVQMIQLNNGRNTFLIDIWHMNQLGDFEAFWLARKILRNLMLDQNIVKIFHDCRHDSIGLHEMIQTCIKNVFDTSATETLINQMEAYQRLWKEKAKIQQGDIQGRQRLLSAAKQVVAQCTNVKTPGLNQILLRYQASHGINKNKDKYHKMWSKGDFSFFCKRPIDPDYRDYCIRDVLDLPEVYAKMLSRLEGGTEGLAYWVSNQYARQGFQALTEEKEK